ncbi:MAG: DUF1501 domain-containing protein [Bacteroidales bacterium]|nr:DUF1501 domain-containing protein [Bacteroidales bacterium]
MLTLLGQSVRYCDGITRRSALKIGAFSFGATTFTLADLHRAEAAAQAANPDYSASRHKAVINIFLGGGPPHQDLFDLKPDAPKEIRGEFQPIKTNVPGMEISEVFPRLAKIMDKCAIIRTMVGAKGGHDAFQCMTGWDNQSLAVLGGRPSLGSVVSRVYGPVDPSVPPFVGLAAPTQHAPWSDAGQAGFLGSSYAAFKPSGPDLANMRLNTINQTQLGNRKQLLAGFDDLRRELDANGSLTAMDAHSQRAMDVLLSSKLIDALDLSKEDPRIRGQYGDGKPYQFQYDGAPTVNDQLLMARRLVQAGARCVSLSYGRWDAHSKNFDMVRDHGGKLDQCLSALILDLERLDLLNDVSVVVWGEFGRTPKINTNAGRDHWPQVSCALLAGGGMRTGQVIGNTNRLGEFAKDRPVPFADVFATLYHNLGLNPETTTVMDPTGRPQHLTEGTALPELM